MFFIIILIAIMFLAKKWVNIPTVVFAGILLAWFVLLDYPTRRFIDSSLGFVIGGRRKMK